jgi:transglutaminase-like putative cysteine protease
MLLEQNPDLYLHPTYFIDSDHPHVRHTAEKIISALNNDRDKAIAIYYWVRDRIFYDPYNLSLKHEAMKASNILQRTKLKGFCIEKSVVMAALCRAVGIPARLVFFNVRNHIGVEKLVEILKTDVIVFHGCNELLLDGKWVKCTPAFNKELCDHLGVVPLEFDGGNDSIFQAYDKAGEHFMEYLHHYGSFHDMPHDMFIMEMQRYYPHFFENPRYKSFMQKVPE